MMYTVAALLLLLCGVLYGFYRKSRVRQDEDGHDRAERRERDWYRL
jgi:hypothetical protein